MRGVSRSAPVLLVLGLSLAGCSKSGDAGKAGGAPQHASAANSDVVLKVPEMH
jgi:hypothetical protein